jgi:hypothetical protein
VERRGDAEGGFDPSLVTRSRSTVPGTDQDHQPGDDAGGARAALVGLGAKLALVVAGASGIVGWLVLSLVHLGDRYNVGHVQGAWMALARYANEGILYPPLYDGARYGGTRWMALPVLVNAAAARLTGELLTSGKAVAILLFAALLVLVFVVLRQLRCPWPMAVALTGLIPATEAGVLVGSTVGGDVLPVAAQLAALLAFMAALRRDRLGWLLTAGTLAGLAAASKLTGVWAALAVLSWLGLRRDWRRLGWFVAACGISAALALGIVQWASEGRFLTTFLTLTFAGTGGPVGWIRAPNQLMLFGIRTTPAIWIIAPFAVLSALSAGRALTVYHHALVWSLLLTTLVFTDMGASMNHLLDLAVLTVVTVGYLASRLPMERLGAAALNTVLVLAVLWAAATGVRGFVPDLREAAAIVRTGVVPPTYSPRPLADLVAPGDTLLAEDPSVPVLLGRVPTVLDPFMLRRIDQVQPDAVDALVARIERGEFDHVVFTNSLDEDNFWWQHYHFGLRTVTALRQAYVLVGRFDGYYVYAPAS